MKVDIVSKNTSVVRVTKDLSLEGQSPRKKKRQRAWARAQAAEGEAGAAGGGAPARGKGAEARAEEARVAKGVGRAVGGPEVLPKVRRRWGRSPRQPHMVSSFGARPGWYLPKLRPSLSPR